MANPVFKGRGAAVTWLRDRVDHKGDDCLIWPFAIIRGYGCVCVNNVSHYAHRFMCELVHGPAPDPKYHAAHSCGKGQLGCVNPNHIFWKSASENERDKRGHGTMYRGGYRKKLRPEEVIAIRLLRDIRTQEELAAMFYVSRRNIGSILEGRTWAYLPQPSSPV